MNHFLKISNPGIANHLGLTLLGVSTTRNNNTEGTIGNFGSGTKHSIALLLREGIRPIIYTGNLKMEFFTKPELVQNQQFNRVMVKYSGKTEAGTKNTTADLGFTLEWGQSDWCSPQMAIREFVSNAIDGALCNGCTIGDVELDLVEKPRAKADYTTIYIPYEPCIERVYKDLGKLFLHFHSPGLLSKKLLPKQDPKFLRVYKKGVLVTELETPSVYDYNLGDELRLDESRNASEYEVKHSVGLAIRDATQQELQPLMAAALNNTDLWENRLDRWYFQPESNEQKTTFKKAWVALAGENTVIHTGNPHVEDFIRRKGFKPVAPSVAWMSALQVCGVQSEISILTLSEREGKQETDPTPEMEAAVKWAWGLIETYGLTNGRKYPTVKGFTALMDAGSMKLGYYQDGVVALNKDLGGTMLASTALEETVHHCTGSSDFSRDLQDFLFTLITKMAL